VNTARRGNSAENFIARRLRDTGWLVGSLRHSKGAGDLIAIWPHQTQGWHPAGGEGANVAVKTGKTLLVECKSAKSLWQQFRREDRAEMRATPLPPGGERYVVNKYGGTITWTHEDSWP
jgi:Holliday junction resolvase